jgi:hypothetical protein
MSPSASQSRSPSSSRSPSASQSMSPSHSVSPSASVSPSGSAYVHVFVTSGTTWSVPSDFNSSDNTIECIGAGGVGGGNGRDGSGGGAYAKKANLSLTPGASIAIQVGVSGSWTNSATIPAARNTFFNGATMATSTVGAEGGADGLDTVGAGGSGAGGTATNSVGDTKYAGGNGGTSPDGFGGGGGGGAAGINGAGANATNASAGSNATGGNGATADNGSGGAGGSGGVGGADNNGVAGSDGTEWDATHGSGGGGGGGSANNSGQAGAGGAGGKYGGGGGGGGHGNPGDGGGTAGGAGLIVITYLPTPTGISPSSSASSSPSPSQPQIFVFEDLIRFFVDASDGNTYGFGNTGYIYKRDVNGLWSVVHKATGQIKGAAEMPQDNGLSYLVWAEDTDLHIKPLPGSSSWSDVDTRAGWPKTNLTSADWHTIQQISGDTYICNSNVLAMVGYDGSYTNNALQLVPGNLAKTLVDRNGHVITGTYPSANPNKGANASIDTEYPLSQLGDDGDIYLADMVNAIPATRFPGGGQVNPGGVASEVNKASFFDWDGIALDFLSKQTVSSMSLWAVYGADTGKGGVYSYGRKRKNHPFVPNLDYLFDADELGAMINVDGLILVSYRQGVNFGVKSVDPTTKTSGVYEGLDLKAPAQLPIKITQWSMVELTMAPLPAGCSVELWYRLDKNGDFVQATLGNLTDTSYNTVNGIDAIFAIGGAGQFFEPKIVLNPYGNTSPEVYKARIFFK